MRYLFFDIECCNGRNICEFGYVITDTDFNVLEKKDITINPENKFKLTGRSNRPDLTLSFPESVYYKSPKFPIYYEQIKSLVEFPDQLVIGHAIINDAIFLNNECRRYGLDSINFKFADSQMIFAEYNNEKRSISLEKAGDLLEVVKPEYLHKSDDDSQLTMELVKGMCHNLECSVEELISLCDTCTGKNENLVANYDTAEIVAHNKYLRLVNDTSNFLRGSKYRMFLKYCEKVKSSTEIVKSELNGKKVCISLNYEVEHAKEMFSLVQLLANHKAKYISRASNSNYFIKEPETSKTRNKCSRLKHVEEANNDGKNIKIISFEELLAILGTSEEALKEMPYPEEEVFQKNKPVIDNKKTNKNHGFTFADFL